jgi:hypothetical protein
MNEKVVRELIMRQKIQQDSKIFDVEHKIIDFTYLILGLKLNQFFLGDKQEFS